MGGFVVVPRDGSVGSGRRAAAAASGARRAAANRSGLDQDGQRRDGGPTRLGVRATQSTHVRHAISCGLVRWRAVDRSGRPDQ